VSNLSYADNYRNIDFRKHPEKYLIGRGEQGVLMAEPYKSEILPFWRFSTPEKSQVSAEKIYSLYLGYQAKNEFVGMDMARKFLQMGFTRARRYANHASGKKYNNDGSVIPQDSQSETSLKAKSAQIFRSFYLIVVNDEHYKMLTQQHKEMHQ
jgi:hypothetical protein